MTELPKTSGNLYTPTIYVECPDAECMHEFDIFDQDESYETANTDDGESLAWKLFSGWMDNKQIEIEAVCPSCEKRFTINKLEY